MNALRWLAALSIALATLAFPAAARNPSPQELAAVSAAELPAEARATIALIRQGGPFAHAKDGSVFGNREGRLPRRERGYYREYTVRTPGERTRGARRIVAGSGGELYYSSDHYATFRRILE